MTGSRLEQILDYPYRRLDGLLGQTTSDLAPLLMHVGEPKFGAPALVAETVAAHAELWNRYPAVDSAPVLRQALSAWFTQRFNMQAHPLDPEREIHPLCGSKEGLFQSATAAVLHKEAQLPAGTTPVVIAPNPLYHPYFGAALCTQSEFYALDLHAERDFRPDLSSIPEDVLKRTAIMFLCTPGNPTGALASHADLKQALELARQYNFILASDECYSEVYYEKPPPGLLEVCGADRSNAIVLNSLSKRSAAPGLRSGVIAGDERLIDLLHMVRGYIGAQVPGPLAMAAAACWSDETHVEGYRKTYRHLRLIADELLGDLPGYRRPQAGFFVWLNVVEKGGGAQFSRHLWQRRAVKALPGEIMARPSAADPSRTPADDYIRLPLVYAPDLTRDAFSRIRTTYEEMTDV